MEFNLQTSIYIYSGFFWMINYAKAALLESEMKNKDVKKRITWDF